MKMALNKVRAEQLSLVVITFGVALAILGTVRTGAIFLALGSAAFSYLKYQRVEVRRRIELFLPLAISCALLVVAITLPHGR